MTDEALIRATLALECGISMFAVPGDVDRETSSAPSSSSATDRLRSTLSQARHDALVEGGAYMVDIEMEIEANTNSPGVTVNLVSIDGVTTTTGITTDGATFTPTWAWTADGDKVTITMVGRGVSIPDTRPAVVVSVQETAAADPVEFVLTAESGSGRPG